jgi:hypothetical protein
VNAPRHRGQELLPGTRRRVGVIVASFALLLQALLPLSFVTGAAASAASGGLPMWSMGALCTAANGTTAPDEAPAPARQIPGSHAICRLCLGLHLADVYLPPATPPVLVLRDHPLDRRARAVAVARPDERRSATRARAPPGLV